MKTTLIIKGTHCASCQALIEEVFGELPGVRRVGVDFVTGRAEIEHDAPLAVPVLQKALTEVGDYTVEEKTIVTKP